MPPQVVRGRRVQARQRFVAARSRGRDSAAQALSHGWCDAAFAMRVTITCEECGERHRLERRITEPGPIWIICHNCELPLQAVLEGSTTEAVSPPKPSAWTGVVDFSSAA
jgi:hypothetical protein